MTDCEDIRAFDTGFKFNRRRILLEEGDDGRALIRWVKQRSDWPPVGLGQSNQYCLLMFQRLYWKKIFRPIQKIVGSDFLLTPDGIKFLEEKEASMTD